MQEFFAEDEAHKELESSEKWIIATLLGVIFVLLASPLMFRITDSVTRIFKLPTLQGSRPTSFGWILHVLLFILIVRLLMK